MTLTVERALSESGKLQTSNFGVATHALTEFYVPHDLRVTSRRRFELDGTMVTAGNVRVGLLKFGTDVSVNCEADPGGFVMSYATEGAVVVGSGNDEAIATPTHAALLSVGKASRFDIPEDATLVTMTFGRGDVEAELSALLGYRIVRPIVFDLGLDVRSGPGGSLMATMELFRAQVTGDLAGGYPVNPVYAASLARATITALLLSFGHNYDEELRFTADADPMPPAIQRAVQAIKDDPTSIHRADDLAQIAIMSLRALEAGFVRYVGESPMAYVRRVRFDRARAQLLAGAPETLTVAAVANRWAFYHQGRFSATYRRIFGENPSATLNRGPTERAGSPLA